METDGTIYRRRNVGDAVNIQWHNENDPAIAEWLQRLIDGPLSMSIHPILPATPGATSSADSDCGNLLCDGQDGRTSERSGLARAPVSPTPWPARAGATSTSETSGPSGDALSTSADLQRSLESRLRLRLEGYGSPEYALTWRHWDMPSGQPIFAVRASRLRQSGSVYSGWAAPRATECGRRRSYEALVRARQRGGSVSMEDQTASVTGWATALTRDAKDTSGMEMVATNLDGSIRIRTDSLPRQSGTITSWLDAASHAVTDPFTPYTGPRHANPEHSRWVNGIPIEWSRFAATATP